jgi:hypothetical protein
MEKMTTISKIPLGVLKNEEFFQIGDQTMVAIESNNCEALKLRGVINLFEESLVAARTKTDQQRMHPLTPPINALVEHIDNGIVALMSINRGHKRVVPIQQKLSAAITVPFIEGSFSDFPKQNIFVKAEWLKKFFNEIEKNNSLSDALTAMNLKPMLDDLRLSYTELMDKRTQRTREKSPLTVESNQSQIQHAKRMLRSLFMVIETNALLEKELNYEPLIININSILSEVMRGVNMRGAAKSNVSEEVITKTAPESVNTSEAADVNQKNSDKPSL